MIIKEQKLSVAKQEIPFQVVANQHALLIPLGDIHFSEDDFPERHFTELLSWGTARGALFIGMGEYLDLAPASQRKIIGSLRDETQRDLDSMVRERIDKLYELMKPTTGKWIGLLEGDHRWDFQDGTSADQYLCQKLKCDFLGTSALVTLKLDKLPKGHREGDTRVYVHHGVGTSRKAGGHLHRVQDLMEWIDSDIYLMGHSHAKVAAPIDWQTVSPDGIHYHKTKLIARTGSYLKGYKSSGPLNLGRPVTESRGKYVERSAYTPSALGSIAIGIGFDKIHGSKFYKPALHLSL